MSEVPRRRRRGIYLLPTLFTVGNMFCGFSSIVLAARGQLEQAAVLIVVATVLDGFDGRIARLTGTSTPFGLEFDSLADIVSFGIAPAMLWHHWALAGRLGWLVAFLYVVCAAMRLARFNLGQPGGGRRYMVGLPSPMAGSALAAVVFAFPGLVADRVLSTFLAVIVAAIALLMISHVRYRSFKEFDLRNRRSYVWVLPMAAVLVGIALHPKSALLLVFSIYLLSGPFSMVGSWIVRTDADADARHETSAR